jgi:hypothetical protein
MKYLRVFSIALIFSKSLLTSSFGNIISGDFRLEFQDTTPVFRSNAKLIDTVKESEIIKLCDHCAMAIRFQLDTPYQKSEFVDIIIFSPNYKVMKLDKPGGIYSIKAFTKYKGPGTLIVQAMPHKNDVPLLWCDSIAPNF